MHRTIAMILAGGEGRRLSPLTQDRAKPAVPFGGKYRIIDFTLSNCTNSGIRRIAVLTQYKSFSLDRHIRLGWNIVNPEAGEFITSVPPQHRIGTDWYLGTADAIHQNMYLVEREGAEYLLVLSGDHIYKMDYSQMFQFHKELGAAATVAAIRVPIAEASRFGVLQVDAAHRVMGFQEKPAKPTPLPDDPSSAYCSMGIYLFTVARLKEHLTADAGNPRSVHDFGKDVLPAMQQGGGLYAFDFANASNFGTKGEANYWMDIGTIDAYWEANMDLVSVSPRFNLYDKVWPVRTNTGQSPPAKFVFADPDEKGGRRGMAIDSIVCGGCIVSGGRVQNTVLSRNVRIGSYADVKASIIFDDAKVGRHAILNRVIVDKRVEIPEKLEIGVDLELDRKRFAVTPSGVVVVTQEMIDRLG
ncbi:MAG: glucose-1-phosphate adenylyltransferase [Nitrospirae bacterium]|nr:glucose-1-phosphate adenylyltransferase [Nitrospirota bacterium]